MAMLLSFTGHEEAPMDWKRLCVSRHSRRERVPAVTVMERLRLRARGLRELFVGDVQPPYCSVAHTAFPFSA